MPDWIETFMSYTDGVPSPDLFRLWSAIGVVGAAMERRVWVETSRSVLYPNLFTLLVGPPGTGKDQAIDPARDLLRSARVTGTVKPLFHLSPDDMTGASLVDALFDAERKIILPQEIIEYHSLCVFAPELGTLIQQYDLSFLSKLNSLYGNPRTFTERRRHNNAGKVKELVAPQLNIIAGSQPTFMASLLPEEAWGMGFTSRLICVYAASGPIVDYFEGQEARLDLRKDLIAGLETLGVLRGRATFEPDAKEFLMLWVRGGMEPVPQHSKLQHYNARRGIHLLKLCLIANVSETLGASLSITKAQCQRAQDWLLACEQVMPDLFRDMVLRSDSQTLQELHFFLTREHIRTKKPIHEAMLIRFLSTKVPGEKVLRLLEIAERSDVVTRLVGEKLYLPRMRPQTAEE